MVWIILFIVVVMGITLAVLLPGAIEDGKKRKAALASGDLIKRNPSFYKDKEFFKANIQDQDAFFNALSEAVKRTQVCSFSGNYNSSVVYRGNRGQWSASLVRLQSDDGSVMFSFGLSNYTSGGRTESMQLARMSMDLNFLLTAIEKTFVQFDPQTQVNVQAINFKTHY
ncbi:MAG: hypothetical protein IJM44_02020 [Ruminococcus sp.]|nr:hypothetical protein [Ruminococcus sp.]